MQNMNTNKTIIVGMSGGVDSSVAALLLKEQGYKIKGLFMQNWQTEAGEECTSEIDFKDASNCLLYTSPSPRDGLLSRMPSSA